jgi:hypothetical protein
MIFVLNIKSDDDVQNQSIDFNPLKKISLYFGIPALLIASYFFIPEGKNMNSYGELSPIELSQASKLLKQPDGNFENQVKIINTLYHKLHGFKLSDEINIKEANFRERIKLIYPGFGHISFYPNGTIYMIKGNSLVGFLAHEIGHMTYQSFKQHLHDNIVKSNQYDIFSLDAAGVDEGPSIFSQFEYAAIAANYDQELSSQIHQSLSQLPNHRLYAVPMNTIHRLIDDHGDAVVVKNKLFELSCYKNYEKYLSEPTLKPSLAAYVSNRFKFYSYYLREGSPLSVMEPLVREDIKNARHRQAWLLNTWNRLAELEQKKTLAKDTTSEYRVWRSGKHTPQDLELEIKRRWNYLDDQQKIHLAKSYHPTILEEDINSEIKKHTQPPQP